MASGSNRAGIFVSYSHDDQKWLTTLLKHLRPLIREQDIDVWDDTRLDAGAKWRQEIEIAIQRAKAAVLLISPNFMASDFIADSELPSILNAAAADGLTILPLIIRRSAFDRDERLNQFQSINSPSQPLIDMETGKRDVVFEKLAETIEHIVGRPGPGAAKPTLSEPPGAQLPVRKPVGRKAKQAAAERRPATAVTNHSEAPVAQPPDGLWPPRVYVSTTGDPHLDARQRSVKQSILRAVSASGLQPQEFGASGLPARMVWNFEAANEVMSNCQGILVLAQARYRVSTRDGSELALASEYNHLEGGMAISRNLPSLVIAEQGIESRGIAFRGDGLVVTIPAGADEAWVDSGEFAGAFESWRRLVRSRSHVFLGYSRGSLDTGSAIASYLKSLGVSVFDLKDSFMPGQTAKEAVDRGLSASATSIFVFTKDDDMAARSNLAFELGYFLKAKGLESTLVIFEAGTLVPSDLSGLAFVSLRDPSDIRPIQPSLRAFIHARL